MLGGALWYPFAALPGPLALASAGVSLARNPGRIGTILRHPTINASSEGLHDGAKPSGLSSWMAYLNLTKPRLLPMVLFTGLPLLGLAAGGWPSPGFSLAVLLGVALAAASANALNAWVERDLDARMERTRRRPLPAGELTSSAALRFAVALGFLSTALLGVLGGWVAASLCVGSILFYVLVYTIWLKPRTAWNTVVGAVAGAAAPILADATINGSVGLAGFSLFAIVFAWQPPHVFAIALYRKAEYEAAGVVMLPTAIGDAATRRWIVVLSLALIPVSLLPYFAGFAGPVYVGVALLATFGFIGSAIHLLFQASDDAARWVFRASLGWLFAIFLAINLEIVFRTL